MKYCQTYKLISLTSSSISKIGIEMRIALFISQNDDMNQNIEENGILY